MILFFVLAVVSGAPWVVLARRFGHILALCGVVAVGLLGMLGILVISRLARIDPVVALAISAVLVGAVGYILLRRNPVTLLRPSRHTVALWLPACTGAAGWIGTMIAAQVVPGAARLSWSMNGDAFNNLFYAQRILTDQGLALSASENPVPLPASLIALGLAPWRGDAPQRMLLEHDVASLTVVWTLVLAVLCILTGVVIASAIPPRRTVLTGVASALGSLLPLTWYVGGLPAQWGYFNVHVVLSLVLAAWLVFLASRAFPVASIVVLSVISTLVLATWSPLVLVPGTLTIVILVRHWAILRVLTGARAIAFLLGASQLLAWLAFVTVPTFLSQGSALEATGHGFPSVVWTIPLLLIALLLVAGWLHRHAELPLVVGVVALAVASILTMGFLIFTSHSGSDPFTAYYPMKLAWILSVLLGIVLLSVVVAGFGRLRRRQAMSGVVGATIISLTVAILSPPGLPADSSRTQATGRLPGSVQQLAGLSPSTGVITRQPTIRILNGLVWHTGDVAAQRIFALAGAPTPGLLWQSNDPAEAMINFWVIVSRGADLTGNLDSRAIAFEAYRAFRATGTWRDYRTVDLCRLLTNMKPSPVVHTANPQLETEIAASCPGVAPRVIVSR